MTEQPADTLAAQGDTLCWLDGERTEVLPLPDRGLEFGDGLFETLLFAQGRLFYPERHFARLSRGLQVLGFPRWSSRVEEYVRAAVAELSRLGIVSAAVRLTVTRGSGPRGYAPPVHAMPRTIISAAPVSGDWRQQSSPVCLGVAGTRWATQPQLAGLKHLNRLEQVLAARERQGAGLDELLMLDQSGNVVSVVSGNLFVVSNGVLLTPPLSLCGIAGTRRELVLNEWSLAIGIQAEERLMGLAELESAEEVFYTNALVGLRPVGRLGERRWSSFPVCEALHGRYIEDNP